jgi:hypothetical protein
MSHADVAPINRRPRPQRRWVVTLVLGLALVALIVAMVVPTLRRQSQYSALRARGITTTARIAYCATASNSRPTTVTVTCPGTFTLGGAKVSEDILGVPAPLAEGAHVLVMVDPKDPHDVYPKADVRSNYRTGWLTEDTFVAVLAAGLFGLTIASQVITVRKRRRTTSRG